MIVGESDLIDLYSATLISHLSNVEILTLRHIGHEVPIYIHEVCGNLNYFIEDIINKNHYYYLPNLYSTTIDILLVTDIFNAYIEVNKKRFDTALRFLEPHKTKLHLNEHFHYYYSICLRESKNLNQALKYAQYAAISNPYAGLIHQNLGVMYNITGDYDKAYDTLITAKNCKRLAPNKQIEYFIGLVAYNQKKYDLAISQCLFCLQNNIKIKEARNLLDNSINNIQKSLLVHNP